MTKPKANTPTTKIPEFVDKTVPGDKNFGFIRR